MAIQSTDKLSSGPEEDHNTSVEGKPQMVRRKSGEIVRPALRASHRRPSSVPSTPIFSKAVHFDSHLEHVRHFLRLDRPLSVGIKYYPAETYQSDNEYPFPGNNKPDVRSQWELITTNPPHVFQVRKTMPVRLENVWLSGDRRSMLGSVAVANLAYQKHVTCRFTLDYWKTVSEVAAGYSHEIYPRETPLGYDRFIYIISLSDLANLESKTMFFCIRYRVNDQEFWDNNDAMNFQVEFKNYLPHNVTSNKSPPHDRVV
ncbi:hypothetical protein HIM_11858 [Hirsutella minnesotensis 3608]|uniref:CBM21 domain-containing protein n=1 Tax=Hirsutella minnesotensis 3608 TaxID=1043627 RepID=A0A0F8A0Q2_9HYPO|nr:hypothetical protein HIM_11858 [Hirsutella minnesotensis 3608]